LIVEHTEALHVIDVNSGRRTKNNENQESNALEVNLNGVEAIARQLRLKDMGGIIVIDFIDLNDSQHRIMLYKAMCKAIEQAHLAGDSVGGVIECAVVGLSAGFGGADIDDTAEGIFARHLFAVPAVKGVEFGSGFALARMKGTEANDAFIPDGKGGVCTQTNHNGGINGGISNGMPLVFSVAIKPTPSIAQTQKTIDLRTHEPSEITIQGRHDPCIVPRAVPVIEAMAALSTLELCKI